MTTDTYKDEVVESQRRIEATLELLRERYPAEAVREALQNVADDADVHVDTALGIGTYNDESGLGKRWAR